MQTNDRQDIGLHNQHDTTWRDRGMHSSLSHVGPKPTGSHGYSAAHGQRQQAAHTTHSSGIFSWHHDQSEKCTRNPDPCVSNDLNHDAGTTPSGKQSMRLISAAPQSQAPGRTQRTWAHRHLKHDGTQRLPTRHEGNRHSRNAVCKHRQRPSSQSCSKLPT